jgi:hypothetical protein
MFLLSFYVGFINSKFQAPNSKQIPSSKHHPAAAGPNKFKKSNPNTQTVLYFEF